MASARQLDTALARLDDLLAALKSGALNSSSGASQQRAVAPPHRLAAPVPPAASAAAASGKQAKKQKAAKNKPSEPAAEPATEGDAFSKAHLAIGRVTSVDNHPSGSEKLWLCKIDVGDGKERQVVAGLKQHVSREELTGRLVAVVLNLKPAKLAGELSEAMVLAAEHQPEGGDVLVRVLLVPDGCQPGDLVMCEGSEPAVPPKECKSKFWKEVVEGLAVRGGVARYKNKPLVTWSGPVKVAADMPDGAGIH